MEPPPLSAPNKVAYGDPGENTEALWSVFWAGMGCPQVLTANTVSEGGNGRLVPEISRQSKCPISYTTYTFTIVSEPPVWPWEAGAGP